MQQIIIQDYVITVIRKRIKNIYLRVNAATKAIQLSAPIKESEVALHRFVESKIAWIRKCLSKSLAGSPTLKFESDEIHYFEGKECQLKIRTDQRKDEVNFQPPYIHLHLRKSGDIHHRKSVLDKWYCQQLMASATELFAIWQPIMNVKISELKIRKMKSRWGSCHPIKRRICLNLELVKKPLECLEYVIVHELTHLYERGHNRRFYAYMDRFLPDWRVYKKRLNQGRSPV